jgi:hypothetical protein
MAMNPLSRGHATIVMICLGTLLASRDLSADELPDVADRVQASSVFVVVEKTHTVLQAPERRDKGAEATKSNLRYGAEMVFSANGYLITITSLIDKCGGLQWQPGRTKLLDAIRALRSRF